MQDRDLGCGQGGEEAFEYGAMPGAAGRSKRIGLDSKVNDRSPPAVDLPGKPAASGKGPGMGRDGSYEQARGYAGRQVRQEPASRFRNTVGEQIQARTVTSFRQDAGGVLIRQGVAEHREEPLRLPFIEHRAGWIDVTMADARAIKDPAGRIFAKQRR